MAEAALIGDAAAVRGLVTDTDAALITADADAAVADGVSAPFPAE